MARSSAPPRSLASPPPGVAGPPTSHHWVLTNVSAGQHPAPGEPCLPISQANALLAQLGQSHRDAVAEALLRVLGAHVPLAQCAIFSFEDGQRPQLVAVGDRSRTGALPRIAQAYVRRFSRLDPVMAVMAQALPAALRSGVAHPMQPLTVLHRQRPADIAHAEYRQVCYELPRVAERLAVLSLHEGRRWMAVYLYRGLEHGPFDDTAVAVVQAFAPLVVHAVRLHHTGHALQQDLSGLMLARIQRRCPDLTPRELDVLRGLLQGLDIPALAAQLGVTVASAQTYIKRTHRKLGVSGRRDLLAWLMEPTTPD